MTRHGDRVDRLACEQAAREEEGRPFVAPDDQPMFSAEDRRDEQLTPEYRSIALTGDRQGIGGSR